MKTSETTTSTADFKETGDPPHEKMRYDRISLLKSISQIIAIIVAIIGFLILFGWAFNIPMFKSPGPAFSTVKSNVGLAFIAIGISLWIFQIQRENKWVHIIAQIFSVLAIILGCAIMLEYFFNLNLGIDQMMFREAKGALLTYTPNRMAFTAALNISLLGLALLSMDQKTKGGYRVSQALAIISGFLSLLSLLGYVYGVQLLYYIPNYTSISIYAAFTFFLMAVAVLFAQPDKGPMGVITSDYFGGYLARRLIPVAIIIPIFFGELAILGQYAGFYGGNFSVSLVVISTTIIFILVIWWNSLSFNWMDIKRERAEIELKRYKDNLEIMVQEKTAELTSTNLELEDEVKERKSAEEELKKSLGEKELLMKEIHHRVKNNLMVIYSLLNLQSRYIKDKETKDIFQESQRRARSMALIHELLYQSQQHNEVDFGSYIHTISTELFRNYSLNSEQVKLNLKTEDIMLDVNTAVPLGLIVNELVSNSMKHAFPDEREGEIDIRFFKEDDNYVLVVKDDGVGMPPDLDINTTETLGLQVVDSLITQIHGDLKLIREGGTTFQISFREPDFRNK
ncbi:MAG: nitrate/nitrite sensor protein NarQ [Methanobacterium sp. PtaB.Bin024]|nr:MAG: nitrate/nitrite sensor protein NarQ [Methanobacterium sp. PtaB.Bin024]